MNKCAFFDEVFFVFDKAFQRGSKKKKTSQECTFICSTILTYLSIFLMTVGDIEQTRHRKPINAATHILTTLIRIKVYYLSFFWIKANSFYLSIQKDLINK